jgi:hypothetical protein
MPWRSVICRSIWQAGHFMAVCLSLGPRAGHQRMLGHRSHDARMRRGLELEPPLIRRTPTAVRRTAQAGGSRVVIGVRSPRGILFIIPCLAPPYHHQNDPPLKITWPFSCTVVRHTYELLLVQSRPNTIEYAPRRIWRGI